MFFLFRFVSLGFVFVAGEGINWQLPAITSNYGDKLTTIAMVGRDGGGGEERNLNNQIDFGNQLTLKPVSICQSIIAN